MPDGRTIVRKGKTYELRKFSNMWFFRLAASRDVGWTCCSPEFVKVIESTDAEGG